MRLNALDATTKKKMVATGTLGVLLAAGLLTGVGLVSWLFSGPRGSPITFSLGIYVDSTVHHAFADFVPYDENFTANAPQYILSPGLANVINLDRFSQLTPEQRSRIEQNGFVVVPQNAYDQIYEILVANEEEGLPSFVTSDAVLHAFHVLYDYALREAEVYSFWDILGNLTMMMLDASETQYQQAPAGRWRDAAERNVMFFAVAASLLGQDVTLTPSVQAEVDKVLALINEHAGATDDWFMGYLEDFSQFIPRGHYTRSETLSHYFLAMMWYGRVAFRLMPNGPVGNNDKGMNETAQAILITLALEGNVPGLGVGVTGYDAWDAIYIPTAFFVGDADDLTPREYLTLVERIYGLDPSLADLNNDTLLTEFIQQADTLRDPQIMSSLLMDTEDISHTKGLRFMSQRYVPDSYILGQLVYVHVQGRFMPKGLDVMAALGSERAWDLLESEKDYPGYVNQMARLREQINSLPPETWTSNLYYLWLYSLLPLLNPPTDRHPTFMQSQAWVDKQLMTALASWTELRHDTILYAKQSYTFRTSMPPTNPYPGYVEPVPALYGRLASLCGMMLSGIGSRGLVREDLLSKLSTLEDLLLGLRAISIKELQGEPLNSTEKDLLRHVGGTLDSISSIPADDELTNYADKRMALVADVHTDPNSGRVLEEAVGDPMMIYVAVYIDGAIVLTRGGTFSYYEFTQPMSDRLTDEQWQQMLDSGEAPSMPDWTSGFLSTVSGSALSVLATTDRWSR